MADQNNFIIQPSEFSVETYLELVREFHKAGQEGFNREAFK
jgi:hypothetical protein